MRRRSGECPGQEKVRHLQAGSLLPPFLLPEKEFSPGERSTPVSFRPEKGARTHCHPCPNGRRTLRLERQPFLTHPLLDQPTRQGRTIPRQRGRNILFRRPGTRGVSE